jgi:Secretion system C-terminal sorting domain
MKHKLKSSLIALVIGVSYFTTTAQTTTLSPLENLFRIEGSWAGEATLILEGNTFNFIYYADFKKNDEGTGMYMEEWFSHPDLGSLKGYNLIGYNARDEKIHWFSVDNFGTCHDHFGYWKTNDHFYMETTEKRGGKKFEEKIDIVFNGTDEVTLHLIATIGGQLVQDAMVIFHRQITTGKNSTKKEEEPASKSSVKASIEVENSGFKVYPNPAKDNINFQLPINVASPDLKLFVFNVKGEKLKEVMMQSAVTRISTNAYVPGIYFYKVINKDGALHTGKFIIQ